jgi:hypothetical protein
MPIMQRYLYYLGIAKAHPELVLIARALTCLLVICLFLGSLALGYQWSNRTLMTVAWGGHEQNRVIPDGTTAIRVEVTTIQGWPHGPVRQFKPHNGESEAVAAGGLYVLLTHTQIRDAAVTSPGIVTIWLLSPAMQKTPMPTGHEDVDKTVGNEPLIPTLQLNSGGCNKDACGQTIP